MTTTRWCTVVGAALLALAAGRAQAQDTTRDRDRTQLRDPASHTGTTTPDQDRLRTQDRLRDVLATDGKLTTAEIATVEGDLRGYAQRGGTEERFRAMVRNSMGEGCKGVCLCEAVRSMHQLMNRGQTAEQAHAALGNMLREQRQHREQRQLALSDQQNQERLRERLREHERQMDRERTREQTREQLRDRDAGSGAAGTGGGQGGGGR